MPVCSHSGSRGGRCEGGSRTGNDLLARFTFPEGETSSPAPSGPDMFAHGLSGSLPAPPQRPPRPTSTGRAPVIATAGCAGLGVLTDEYAAREALNSEYGDSVQTLINGDMSNVDKTVTSR